ncbi:MAG: M36 family metallopeptidase [Nocardioidaceae bacterium]
MSRRVTLRRPVVVVATGLTALVAAVGTSTSAGSYAAGRPSPTGGSRATASDAGRTAGFFDARQGTGPRAAQDLRRRQAVASARPATVSLRRAIGAQAVVDIDGTTGTPRLVGRLDGYLTGPSRRTPRRVALGFVRRYHQGLGLTTKDLSTFHLRRDYRDVAGIHHLSWTQQVGGDDVFGNGLTASVTRNGRLLTLGGSPVSGADPAVAAPRALTSGRQAIRAARRSLDEPSTTPGPRDVARQVLFVTPRGSRLGWQTVTMSAQSPALSVADATTGVLLYRRPLRADAAAPTTDTGDASRSTGSSGLAFRYFPRAKVGGTAGRVHYTRRGWLGSTATTLSGNNSHTYSDVNDDNLAEASEEVHPSSGHRWDYRLKPFHLPGVSFCDRPYPCSWNPEKPYSWRTNRAQNAAQVFFFVNAWHDHLRAAPIGFTEAAGNFQVRNSGSAGTGGDAVDTQTDDGANTANGLPDPGHIDNANMSTPPDGQSPTMQMYLQHAPGTSYPDGDPFSPTNVGDEADTVYHEYTHGLSNRLVVDPGGLSTLGGVQAGAMGEAWSDWYAMDYLVGSGKQVDRPGTADVVLFQYDGQGVRLDRSEPVDCAVGSAATRCRSGETGHHGGYTYADYGHVTGGPEVHADGEIWAQTLWDLRGALGSRRSESVVTRAMELSPSNPSFLDERNAILMADTAVESGRGRAAIWRVFAHRGMGFYAGSVGGDDTTPAADFHTPPKALRTAYVTGRVTDADSHRPLAGVPVTLAFQGGGYVNPTATTAADGRYRLGPVPVGRYGKVGVVSGGFDPVTSPVTVTPAGGRRSFSVRRDWAAGSGGASISDFTGPDFGPDCGKGPEGAIDGTLAVGWPSTTGDDAGTPTSTFVPKQIVIDLPQAVDVSSFAVDPGATCGDGPTSSLGAYTIETSTDGSTWVTASQGAFQAADDGRLNTVTPTAGTQGVRQVRLTMRGNQTPDFATACPGSGDSGCSFTDMSEIEVYGAAG